jgi:hypothetical protein
VEPEKTFTAGQRLGKQIFVATNTQAIIQELLGTMLYVLFMQSDYKEEFC